MLYKLRLDSGYSQLELAKLLNEPQSFVSKVENGERRLSVIELMKILNCYNIRFEDFAFRLNKKLNGEVVFKEELNEIEEKLIQFANGDFLSSKSCQSNDEIIQAIFYGLTMLGEEIHEKFTKLERLKEEIDAERKELLFVNTRLTHDLKAPVNNIKGLLGLLENGDDSKIIFTYLKTCIQEFDKQLALMSKISKIKLKPVLCERVLLSKNISEVLKIYEKIIEKKKIKIKTTIDIDELAIDPYYLDAILQNLIGNAIIYHSKTKGNCLVNIKLNSFESHLILEISDNGSGIPEYIKEQIFEPFKKTNNIEGLGLGLYIVKNAVDNLKGKIELRTSKKGTCYKIIIPK